MALRFLVLGNTLRLLIPMRPPASSQLLLLMHEFCFGLAPNF